MARSKVQGPPNDLDRREKTRKSGKCQRCGTKTRSQFSVLFRGEGKDRKVAKVKAREGESHYCADCAAERVAEKTRYLDAQNGSKPKAKPKAKPKGKAAPKRGKAKAKAAPKRTVKKRTTKRSGSKAKAKAADSEPF
jgi:hypothetical protein